MPGFLGGSSGGTGTGGEISFPKEFIDPVTKLRISQPENLIDTDFEYGLQPTKWETVELINNTPSFFSKSGDTTIDGIVSVTTNNGTREITVTTALDHGLAVGIPISVTGTKSVTADGSYIINSIPNPKTFTYLCKDNQVGDNSIEDLYTSIITGEFFQGSQIRVANTEGIITDGESVSTLTVKTESTHGFGVNTPFYFLNLNSTISQEFEAANTAAKSFDSSNSATAQTFDGSNTLSSIPIDWSNSATIGGTVSNITGVNVTTDVITVSHTTESFQNQPLGTPLYYDVVTSTGYFATNPRGVVFLKTVNQLGASTSSFQVSATPDGDAINIEASMQGTFQLANQARTFAGNNINSSTEQQVTIIRENALPLEGANDGGTKTGAIFDAGNPLCTQVSYSGSLVNVSTTAGAGLVYYQGAMVQYNTTGAAASGLVNNATYFIDSFFSTGTDTYAFTLKELPTSTSVITVSGGSGVQTFRRIGVSPDKNIWHIKNSNFVKGDMLEYSFPEGGAVVTNTNKKYFFVSTVYDTHNYLLDDALYTPTDATGGSISTTVYNGQTYRVHTFTTVGTSTFTVTSVGTDPTVDVLIVGGGGSGSGGLGGGGGAGGMIDTTLDATITKPTLTATSYNIVVGAGATGVVSGEGITTNNATNPSSNGGNSSAFGLIALGGGGAGHHREVRGAGLAGGSGGGAGPATNGTGTTGGAAQQPGSASKGFGNAGGNAPNSGNDWPGAGGGGAGAAGTSTTTSVGPGADGGIGRKTYIDGKPRWYAAGGGGCSYDNHDFGGGAGGIGGAGGGGANGGIAGAAGVGGRNLPTVAAMTLGDAVADPAGGNAGANTGSGGGGSGWNQSRGGDGGSGIVVVRYSITPKQIVTPVASGGTTSTLTVGNITYRLHTFTTPGTVNFTVTEPGNLGEFEYLIVAGGGSGGSYVGGGGGGGGVIEGALLPTAGTYSIVVGAGGTAVGSTSTQISAFGNNGGNSSAFGLTAIGGGGGGVYAEGAGRSGGSGGGAGGFQNGTGSGGAGTAGQGNTGGFTYGSRPRSFTGGGGGGGAAQPGKYSSNASNRGGDGGRGYGSNILGTLWYFGAGGGGGNYTDGASPGNGGLGGGGGGSSNTANVSGIGGGSAINNTSGGNGSPNGDPNNTGGSGAANSGSGGGGCGHYGLSGAGGSGIVVIRYPIAIA